MSLAPAVAPGLQLAAWRIAGALVLCAVGEAGCERL